MKNDKLLNISMDPPKEIGMNFQELVKQGQELIQNISGKSGDWTNYNLSDPGITILEHVCYAITDLSYRISFPVEDLLALQENFLRKARAKVLTPARDILTNNPLTKNDYRKVLIDLPGVKNAWFNIFKGNSSSHKIHGLYCVKIEPNSTLKEITESDIDNIKDMVKTRLNKCRNLCEDIDEIVVFESQPIEYINVKIEIIDNADIDGLMKCVKETIITEFSPQIPFYSLEEMRSVKNKSIEEIFDGPILEHGFIDNTDLANFNKKDKIYVADVINALSKLDGVDSIKELLIGDKSEKSIEYIEIASNKTPFIKKIEIELYNNGRPIDVKLDLPKNSQEEDERHKKDTDWPLPSGQYRHLAEYTSIQDDFPRNYLLTEDIENSRIISDKIKAVTKQLKGYLLIFDQILANSFAQIDNIKFLFNSIDDLKEKPNETKYRTYFTQPVKCVGIELVTDQEYEKELEKIANDLPENARIARKNKLLDYISAIYSLKFDDYSRFALQNNNGDLTPEQKLINSKIDFLIHFLKYGGQRNKTINYDFITDDEQKSPLQLYIIDYISEFLGGDHSWTKDFYMVEHILLRSFIKKEQDLDFLREEEDIYSCQISIILPYNMEKYQNIIQNIVLNAAPAHILFRYYWWENQKIEYFSEIYSKWKKSFSENPRSEENFINSRIILNYLFDLKGIGTMVIRNEGNGHIPDPDPETPYYFTIA